MYKLFEVVESNGDWAIENRGITCTCGGRIGFLLLVLGLVFDCSSLLDPIVLIRLKEFSFCRTKDCTLFDVSIIALM